MQTPLPPPLPLQVLYSPYNRRGGGVSGRVCHAPQTSKAQLCRQVDELVLLFTSSSHAPTPALTPWPTPATTNTSSPSHCRAPPTASRRWWRRSTALRRCGRASARLGWSASLPVSEHDRGLQTSSPEGARRRAGINIVGALKAMASPGWPPPSSPSWPPDILAPPLKASPSASLSPQARAPPHLLASRPRPSGEPFYLSPTSSGGPAVYFNLEVRAGLHVRARTF